MRKVALIIAIAILALFYIYNTLYKRADFVSVKIGDTNIVVEPALTKNEWVQGLSGKEVLPPDQGMFFVFTEPNRYGFWMKEMNFPIDIAWIDANKKIIYIKSNVATSTYPEIFYPESEALYVLETNSGFLDRNGIQVGQTLEMKDI